MSDFRIRYNDEATLTGYARTIGFANGDLTVIGMLPDGSGSFFMTEAMRRYLPTGRMIAGRFGIDVPEMASDGYWWRTLRIDGSNPFGDGGFLLPSVESGIVVYPPGPDQPEVAVIA